MSQRRAISALLRIAVPPTASASALARPGTGSLASTGSPQPRASALAMFPAPINPIRIRPIISYRRDGPRAASRPNGSGLVEEALLDELRALFGADLHVARREHEDLLGDPLDSAAERVGQA